MTLIADTNASRSLAMLLLIFAFTMILGICHPYHDGLTFVVQLFGSVQVFLTVLCCLILKLGQDFMLEEDRVFIEGLMLGCNLLLLCINVTVLTYGTVDLQQQTSAVTRRAVDARQRLRALDLRERNIIEKSHLEPDYRPSFWEDLDASFRRKIDVECEESRRVSVATSACVGSIASLVLVSRSGGLTGVVVVILVTVLSGFIARWLSVKREQTKQQKLLRQAQYDWDVRRSLPVFELPASEVRRAKVVTLCCAAPAGATAGAFIGIYLSAFFLPTPQGFMLYTSAGAFSGLVAGYLGMSARYASNWRIRRFEFERDLHLNRMGVPTTRSLSNRWSVRNTIFGKTSYFKLGGQRKDVLATESLEQQLLRKKREGQRAKFKTFAEKHKWRKSYRKLQMMKLQRDQLKQQEKEAETKDVDETKDSAPDAHHK